MKILKKYPFPAEVIQATDKHGKVSLVVILKATYEFPTINDQELCISEKQVPILATDVFEGEPGLSTPYVESDYAPRKLKCDVILKATAHAPDGRPARRMEAGFRVGSCTKKVGVVGDRTWKKRWFLTWLRGLKITRPQPFTSMPITYARAFGGHWEREEKVGKLECYNANPLGRGFAKARKNRKRLPGLPLPNLEAPKQKIKKPKKAYLPCSFGPIGRSWAPRAAFAGTYDDAWKADVFPLLPQDFDERFFQCAPPDQQIDYPKGGETIELWNLHPVRPHIRFQLPECPVPVLVGFHAKEAIDTQAVMDTVVIDADAETLSVVWRASTPLNRGLREVRGVGIGPLGPDCRMKVITGAEDGGGCGCSQSKDNPEQMVENPSEEESELPGATESSAPRRSGCCGKGRKELKDAAASESSKKDPLAGKVWR